MAGATNAHSAILIFAGLILLVAPTQAVSNGRNLLQDPVVEGPVQFEKVSIGVFVTCGIATTGKLYCMGNNDDGAVGDGTQETRATPTLVQGEGTWTDISGGDWHVCGTKSDSTGYCWGYNGGRLGIGKDDPIQATVPQQLNGSFTQVSAGHFHSCAIKTDGNAVCWGNNKNGRLGTGETSEPKIYENNPQLVKGSNWKTISAKGSHTCALKNDNTAWCWGGNESGELGVGEKGEIQTTPTKVPGSWKAVTSGLHFSCGIDTKDEMYCWGTLNGGASNDTQEDFGPRPKKIGGGGTWKSVSGGMQHVCGLKSDDTARCFGLGWHGQLGNGLNASYTEPFAESCLSEAPCEPLGGGTWKDIASGEYNSCGVKSDSTLLCWGENPYGQLGTGEVGGYVYEPQPVVGVLGVPLAPVLAPAEGPAPLPALAPLAVPTLAPLPAAEPALAPLIALAPAPLPIEPTIPIIAPVEVVAAVPPPPSSAITHFTAVAALITIAALFI